MDGQAKKHIETPSFNETNTNAYVFNIINIYIYIYVDIVLKFVFNNI